MARTAPCTWAEPADGRDAETVQAGTDRAGPTFRLRVRRVR
jgi:hypothetical protein